MQRPPSQEPWLNATDDIQRVLFSGVFAECWAVYTDQMMLDQGYGNGDLKLRLNQFKFYLRAVASKAGGCRANAIIVVASARPCLRCGFGSSFDC